jgi:catalase (peroxidase I)
MKVQAILSSLLFTGASSFAPAFLSHTRTTLHAANVGDLPDSNRRRELLSAPFLALIATSASSPVNAFGAKKKAADYKAVASDIASIVKDDPDKGPTLVRLAWHSSGTYDKMSKDGGSGGGTIRFREELAHGGNAGLGSTAVVWLEDVKKKYGDSLSYADLYTLGGGEYWHGVCIDACGLLLHFNS